MPIIYSKLCLGVALLNNRPFPVASASNWGLVQNLLYENEFDLHLNEHMGKTNHSIWKVFHQASSWNGGKSNPGWPFRLSHSLSSRDRDQHFSYNYNFSLKSKCKVTEFLLLIARRLLSDSTMTCCKVCCPGVGQTNATKWLFSFSKLTNLRIIVIS